MRPEQILLILLGRKGRRSGLQATLASMLIVRASPELSSRARLRRRVSRVFIMLGLVWSVAEPGTGTAIYPLLCYLTQLIIPRPGK